MLPNKGLFRLPALISIHTIVQHIAKYADTKFYFTLNLLNKF